MKHIFFFVLLILSCQLHAQKVAKIIGKCDANKLAKHLDKGGDINEQISESDENGDEFTVSLLVYAVHEGCLDIVQMLVDRKNEIENFDLILSTAFAYSLSRENDDISNLLYQQGPLPKGTCHVCHGNNALMVAAAYGREDWYFKLKPTSDVNFINNVGASLIHAVSSGPSQKIFEDVLQIKSLDINLLDQEEMSCLDYAASNENNPRAFQLLIEAGADHMLSWNIIYWWTMGQVYIDKNIITDRRADVWMIDDQGDNSLMLLSYFYGSLDLSETGGFNSKMLTILNFMIEDIKEGYAKFEFVEQLYINSVTENFLDAMLLISDYSQDSPVYPKYLELIGLICEKHDFCPVYKKEYKKACDIYGEDVVNGWYKEFNLPTE
jgi:ankyrin repeat protein